MTTAAIGRSIHIPKPCVNRRRMFLNRLNACQPLVGSMSSFERPLPLIHIFGEHPSRSENHILMSYSVARTCPLLIWLIHYTVNSSGTASTGLCHHWSAIWNIWLTCTRFRSNTAPFSTTRETRKSHISATHRCSSCGRQPDIR